MPTAISLFSGLGGDTLGLKQAGVNVIAYNEINVKFCKSHEANFPNCELIKDGATQDISKLPDVCFTKFKGTDIIFAGFPCQGFSNAGKKQDNDPRNTLFREFLRATRLIEPSMIIGENVKGLLSRKTNQNGVYYIHVIISEFEQLGYDVQVQVCKTDQYGVPQKRERLIIIGIKKGNPYGWTRKFPEPIKSNLHLREIVGYSMEGCVRVDPSILFEGINATSIVTNMLDTSFYPDNNNAHPYLLSKLNADEARRTYDNKTHPILFSFGKRDSAIHCEIINIDKPAKTIICSYDHQPRFFVPIRNATGSYLRMLLPYELKQIQGFPSDYIVVGSTKEKITQIGNAVPPPLIKAIVEAIIKN